MTPTFRAAILGLASPLAPHLARALAASNLALRAVYTWEESPHLHAFDCPHVLCTWDAPSLTRALTGCNYLFWVCEPDEQDLGQMIGRTRALEAALILTTLERCVITQCISMLSPPRFGGALSDEHDAYLLGTGSPTQEARFGAEVELWRLIQHKLPIHVLYPALCIEHLPLISRPPPPATRLCLTTLDQVVQAHLGVLTQAAVGSRHVLGDWNTRWADVAQHQGGAAARAVSSSRFEDASRCGVWADTSLVREQLGWVHQALWERV